ncbi:MAG: hypothetical protein ACRDSJ_14015 [Rubrobacteraceae bacterium]
MAILSSDMATTATSETFGWTWKRSSTSLTLNGMNRTFAPDWPGMYHTSLER